MDANLGYCILPLYQRGLATMQFADIYDIFIMPAFWVFFAKEGSLT